MNLQESITSFVIACSYMVTYGAKEYELINVQTYNMLLFSSVIILSVIFWRLVSNEQN